MSKKSSCYYLSPKAVEGLKNLSAERGVSVSQFIEDIGTGVYNLTVSPQMYAKYRDKGCQNLLQELVVFLASGEELKLLQDSHIYLRGGFPYAFIGHKVYDKECIELCVIKAPAIRKFLRDNPTDIALFAKLLEFLKGCYDASMPELTVTNKVYNALTTPVQLPLPE
jgi:hypothetical protein